jgi:hypothetical protein
VAKLLESERELVDSAREQVREMLGADTASFVAFVVTLPGSDEFLHKHRSAGGVSVYEWAKSRPEMAHRFSRLKKAEAIVAEKGEARVAVLFETATQYGVVTVMD